MKFQILSLLLAASILASCVGTPPPTTGGPTPEAVPEPTPEIRKPAVFSPSAMPGATNGSQNIAAQEWISQIAQAFEFKSYSFNEYILPPSTSWDQVSAYYDQQMRTAGWEKAASQQQTTFYRNNNEKKYIILVYSPAFDSSKNAYVSLVYSYEVSEEMGAVVSGSYATDYQPDKDGFSFKNYRDEYPRGDMTINELRNVFGDDVCARIEGDKCIPIPNAGLWMQQMNTLSRIGHCTGMTVLSGLFKENALDKKLIDVQTLSEAAQNDTLLRRISADWAVQITEEVTVSTVQGSPKRIVYEMLKTKGLADIGIFSAEGGHSLLGYGVDDKGSGIFWINVYDGNAPGAKRYIQVDINANTWAYSYDGLNPTEDSKAWRGDAESNTLVFMPISTYSQKLTCPFCFEKPASVQTTTGKLASQFPQRKGTAQSTLVSLTGGGNASMRATTAAGQRVGIMNNQLINEVPGARIVRMRGGQGGFVLLLPPDMDFTLAFEGSAGSNLLMMGVGFSAAAFNIPDNSFEIGFSVSSRQVSYSSNGTNSPVFITVTQFSSQKSTMVMVNNIGMQPGQAVNFGQTSENAPFNIGVSGDVTQNVSPSLIVAEVSSAGDQIFASSGWLNINSGSTVGLDLAGSQPNAPLFVTVSTNGNAIAGSNTSGNGNPNGSGNTNGGGSANQSFTIPDQPLSSVLPQLVSVPNIISTFQAFAPYMDSYETQSFLLALGNLGFDGAQLGTVLLYFNEIFALTPQQIRSLALSWGLTGDQLVAFAQALLLSPDQVALITGPIPEAYDPAAIAALGLQKPNPPPPPEDEPQKDPPAATATAVPTITETPAPTPTPTDTPTVTPTPTATVAPCAPPGKIVGSACWYHYYSYQAIPIAAFPANSNCNTMCATYGKTYDPATCTFNYSGCGNQTACNTNCYNIALAFGYPASLPAPFGWQYNTAGLGCSIKTTSQLWNSYVPPASSVCDPTITSPFFERFCACQ